MKARESKTKKGEVEREADWMDTHSIGPDEDSSIRPLALVKAGVVHNPLSGQCERLKGSKKNKASEPFYSKHHYRELKSK